MNAVKPILMTLVFVCFSGCGFIVITPPETPPNAEDTAKRMITCLRLGNHQEANTLLAFGPHASESYVQSRREWIESRSNLITSGHGQLSFMDIRTQGDAAVAVIRHAADAAGAGEKYLPMYLIKRHGVWLISPEFASYKPLLATDSSDRRKIYTSLEIWFENKAVSLGATRPPK